MDLFFQRLGAGPPLLIFHGLFGSLDNWRTHAKQLSQHFTVYSVDLRNHGHSPHAERFDYPAMAADVIGLIENEALPPVTALGHSMGGKVVMQLAKDAPELLERVIVADMSPNASAAGHTAVIKALQAVPLADVSSRGEADAHLARHIAEAPIRQFLLKGLKRNANGGYEWRFNLPVIAREYDNIRAGIEVHPPFPRPALFLRGEHSPYIPDEEVPLIASMFPAYELETIPGAGHWIHAEAPGAFLQAMGSFLQVPLGS